MAQRFLHFLITLCTLIFAILFAAANRTPAQLSLNPFSTQSDFLSFEAPLFMLLLVMLLIGTLLGSIVTWASHGKIRKQMRTERREKQDLIRALKKADISKNETLPVVSAHQTNTRRSSRRE